MGLMASSTQFSDTSEIDTNCESFPFRLPFMSRSQHVSMGSLHDHFTISQDQPGSIGNHVETNLMELEHSLGLLRNEVFNNRAPWNEMTQRFRDQANCCATHRKTIRETVNDQAKQLDQFNSTQNEILQKLSSMEKCQLSIEARITKLEKLENSKSHIINLLERVDTIETKMDDIDERVEEILDQIKKSVLATVSQKIEERFGDQHLQNISTERTLQEVTGKLEHNSTRIDLLKATNQNMESELEANLDVLTLKLTNRLQSLEDRLTELVDNKSVINRLEWEVIHYQDLIEVNKELTNMKNQISELVNANETDNIQEFTTIISKLQEKLEVLQTDLVSTKQTWTVSLYMLKTELKEIFQDYDKSDKVTLLSNETARLDQKIEELCNIFVPPSNINDSDLISEDRVPIQTSCGDPLTRESGNPNESDQDLVAIETSRDRTGDPNESCKDAYGFEILQTDSSDDIDPILDTDP